MVTMLGSASLGSIASRNLLLEILELLWILCEITVRVKGC